MSAPLAVSMGDPAGIAPEITLKAWAALRGGGRTFFTIGDASLYARAASALSLAAPVRVIAAPEEAASIFAQALPVLHQPLAARETPGAADPRNAPAVIAAIETGVRLCREGRAAAIVTCPIAKAALYEAGFAHPGHTEFVAALTQDMAWSGPRGPVMMLAGEELKVALATVHVSLRDAIGRLSGAEIERVARVTADALARDFAIARPRLALAGLNPHAGEAGSLGREEIEIINPAAARLRAQGLDVSDARPPDTLFHAEARKTYDCVIAMYHDQGLIPLKTLHFWDGVNVTLGLPVVRASPDHGVAYDIAGTGRARADSLIAALAMAGAIAARRAAA
ncbi:MAG: 4-hydroxythreonine-4-phosphate dehydrogenase PdxA [Hyphomonadaceae bacterium]